MTNDPETSYMVACLELKLFPERTEPNPATGLDWDCFFDLLVQNRLTGLFYALSREQRSICPDFIHDRLRLEHYAWMLYGDRCTEKVKVALSELHTAGIQVIVLKGWAWIQTLYGGDYSQRYCEDIDLLIRPADVDAAERILLNLGFLGADETWEGYSRRFMNCRAFLTPLKMQDARMFSVGLHWGLIHTPSYDPRQIDIPALFDRAHPIRVVDVDVLELSVEDQITYVCLHLGLHHKYDPSLFRYYELAAVILKAKSTLDWDAVLKTADEWKCIIPAQRVLQYTDTLWQNVVPSVVIEKANKLKPANRERFVATWQKLFGDKVSFSVLLNWLTLPGFWNRIRMAFQDIIPSPAYMRRRYNQTKSEPVIILYFRRFFRSFHFLFRNYSFGQSLRREKTVPSSSGEPSPTQIHP
jgi:hypothetical protein